MKKFLAVLFCAMSTVSFANAATNSPLPIMKPMLEYCNRAVAISDASFCGSFKEVAGCQCRNKNMPKEKCADMNFVYTNMVGYFGSLTDACKWQKSNVPNSTEPGECIDDWNFYRSHC